MPCAKGRSKSPSVERSTSPGVGVPFVEIGIPLSVVVFGVVRGFPCAVLQKSRFMKENYGLDPKRLFPLHKLPP
jgi:hypothetical protein